MKPRAVFQSTIVIAAIVSGLARHADAAETKITWYGHAAFAVTTPKSKVLFIDPWLNNALDPLAKDGKDAVAQITNADYILVTHGHFDHVGDSVALAQKTKARLVTNFELGTNMARMLGFPKDQMGFDTLMNIGGEIPLADGEVTVAMTPAVHSSGMDYPQGKAPSPDAPVAYGGNPAGFVIMIKDGPTIYDTGDTAYFKDMELIGQQYSPDVSLINIGGHFGMQPDMAAKAAAATKSKLVIPHHFKTFPILTQDTKEFFKALDQEKIQHLEMTPGSAISFEGKKLKQ